ncbi:MAG: hypothetical protein R3253_02680 [Longimicrobiales bacterium]|nr:hypothetical protein [Longimicrobiales bacterium]
MTKMKFETNLVGRRVRFADPEDPWTGPVDKKYADLIPPEERKLGSFVPRTREASWPSGDEAEIVAVFPQDGGGFGVQAASARGSYRVPLEMVGGAAVVLLPQEEDPAVVRLERIAEALEAVIFGEYAVTVREG